MLPYMTQNTTSDIETEACMFHEAFKNDFFCLDNQCQSMRPCCVYCFRSIHANCNEWLGVSSYNFKEATTTSVLKTTIDHALKVLENTMRVLESLRQRIPDGLEFPDLEAYSPLMDKTFSAASGRIHLSLATSFLQTIDLLSRYVKLPVTPRIAPTIIPNDLLISRSLQVELHDGGVIVGFKKAATYSAYALTIYDVPVRECRYRMRVRSMRSDNRFVHIGIARRSQYEILKASCNYNEVVEQCIAYFGNGVVYCGIGGAQVYQKKPKEITWGTVFIVDLSVGQRYLRIYTEDERINIVCNEIANDDYFIFHELYFPETSIQIDRVL